MKEIPNERRAPPLNLKSYKIGGLSKALGILRMDEKILIHLDLTFTTAAGGTASATASSQTAP